MPEGAQMVQEGAKKIPGGTFPSTFRTYEEGCSKEYAFFYKNQ